MGVHERRGGRGGDEGERNENKKTDTKMRRENNLDGCRSSQNKLDPALKTNTADPQDFVVVAANLASGPYIYLEGWLGIGQGASGVR